MRCIELAEMGCKKLTYHSNIHLVKQALPAVRSAKSGLNLRRNYIYGFQGQEDDPEIKGKGNSYTAEFWQYDSRLGRRWNTDPVVKEYESPFACFGNNPILYIDPNGADNIKFDEDGNYVSGEEKGKLYEFFFGSKGEVVNSNGEVVQMFKFNDRKDGQIENFLDSGSGQVAGGGSDAKYKGINLEFEEKANGIVDRAIKDAPTSPGLVGKIETLLWIGAQSTMEIGGKDEPTTLDFMTHADEWSNRDDGERINIADGIGYNDFDANNFLWGNAMKKLGISFALTKISSEANGFWFGKIQNQSLNSEEVNAKITDLGALEFKLARITWLGDSRADQKAIKSGFNF